LYSQSRGIQLTTKIKLPQKNAQLRKLPENIPFNYVVTPIIIIIIEGLISEITIL